MERQELGARLEVCFLSAQTYSSVFVDIIIQSYIIIIIIIIIITTTGSMRVLSQPSRLFHIVYAFFFFVL